MADDECAASGDIAFSDLELLESENVRSVERCRMIVQFAGL